MRHADPRFGTSRHVVALVLATETGRPALVAKLPRLAGDGAALSREAAGLTAVRHALGETSSVPRLIAHLTDRPPRCSSRRRSTAGR